jgi:hypothetical protein
MRPLCRMHPFPGIELRVSWRNGPRRNPQNGVEGIHRIEPAIEAKYELIEVGLQMTRFDPAMMRAVDPRLQIGKDKMDHWQVLFSLLWVTPEGKRIVLVAHLAKAIITLPAVSADNGSRRHIVHDECGECFGIAARKRNICLFHARYNAEPEAAGISEFLSRNASFVGVFPFRATILGVLARPNLNGANYRRLMMDAPSFTPRAATNATFVYLDGMRRADSVAVWPNHTGAELVKHRERRFISSDVKLALELEGGFTGRLCSHEVSAPKPSREGHMARLHDRSSRQRCIFLTGAAAQHNRRAGRETVRLADGSALRASEAVRPANRLQIMGASAIIWKDALKFRKARWKGCIHVRDDSIRSNVCQESG